MASKKSKRDPKTPAMLSVLTTMGTVATLSELAASHGNNLSDALSAAIHQYKRSKLKPTSKTKSVVNG